MLAPLVFTVLVMVNPPAHKPQAPPPGAQLFP
jgi:hypothetical protein